MSGAKRYRRAMAAAVLLMAIAGCRQPEGPMPVPNGDQPDRIHDISRDLQNLAGKDANAPAELLDDLTNLDPLPRPAARLKELATALGDSVGGTMLPDAEAEKIANLLFVAICNRDLSLRQIAEVGQDLRTVLVTIGAKAEAADRTAAAATTLANEVTRNKKRWYQRT
jgi:hypothetical protein